MQAKYSPVTKIWKKLKKQMIKKNQGKMEEARFTFIDLIQFTTSSTEDNVNLSTVWKLKQHRDADS